jgi:hypothetical protein
MVVVLEEVILEFYYGYFDGFESFVARVATSVACNPWFAVQEPSGVEHFSFFGVAVGAFHFSGLRFVVFAGGLRGLGLYGPW